jgi:hypothetical protein
MNIRGPLATWVGGALGVACLAVAATACGSAAATSAPGGPTTPTTGHQATETGQSTTSTGGPTTTSSTTAGTTHQTATKVVSLAPVDAQGNLVEGLTLSGTESGSACGAGSEAVAATVYRCFSTRYVYDPCWAASGTTPSVYCMNFPWSTSVVRVELPSLGAPVSVPADPGHPWGVELTDGQRCIAAQGAKLVVGKQVAMYECGFTATSVLLLGSPDRSTPLWTFQTVYLKGASIVYGPTVQVSTAWYGEDHE